VNETEGAIFMVTPTDVGSVDTIAALKQVVVPPDFNTILVEGYYAVGDGGGGQFQWVLGAAVEDGGLVINPNANANLGHWQRIHDGDEISFRWFGASPASNAATNAARIQAALDKGGPCYCPPGTYAHDEVFLRSGNKIRNDGRMAGSVRTAAVPFPVSDTALGNGSLAANATTLLGNFSQYAVGDWVVISLQGAGTAASGNQNGFDFAQVVAPPPSATSMKIATMTAGTGTRWAYNAWKVGKIRDIVYVEETLDRGKSASITLPTSRLANWTSPPAAGDILRLENHEGTDTWWGLSGTGAQYQSAYFEYVRVRSVSSFGGSTTIEFEDTIAYDHDKYWMVRAAATRDISVRGGYVDALIIAWAAEVSVTDLRAGLLSCASAYDAVFSGIEVQSNRIDVPRLAGFTHCRHLTIDGLRTGGANGTTDNGSLKMSGCCDVVVSDIDGYDAKINIPFKSGAAEFPAGAVVTGSLSGATATVMAVKLTSGAWSTGNAAGVLSVIAVSGAFKYVVDDDNPANNQIDQLTGGGGSAILAGGLTQGIFPFFIDYFFAPYSPWAQNMAFSNINLRAAKFGNKTSFLAIGTRDCSFSNLLCDGGIRINRSVRPTLTNARSTELEFADVPDGGMASGCIASFVEIQSSTGVMLTSVVTNGTNNANGNRCLWIHGSCSDTTVVGHFCRSANKNAAGAYNDTGIYVDHSNNTLLVGCGDSGTLSRSVVFGTSPGIVHQRGNAFRNLFAESTPTNSRASSSTGFIWPSIAAGSTATTDIAVAGAIVGQQAAAGMNLNLQGMQLTAYVSSPDTVTCVMFNPTANAIALPSGTLKVVVSF
jgi:hypothetical protein